MKRTLEVNKTRTDKQRDNTARKHQTIDKVRYAPIRRWGMSDDNEHECSDQGNASPR
jgi:hypothetical protein